ncbi:hypothetical protein STA1M1_39380 [Sinisalibacter aestuarii]|uniref:Uncharacterized protein n=1 Tax=Sinisalibacter aestuarii TaxID=2949426 RepID=A0ABQ5LYQ3_9RHOB|nr:hypothetical protein STA1M1_39380 [Sinisalibacter aestuarii]
MRQSQAPPASLPRNVSRIMRASADLRRGWWSTSAPICARAETRSASEIERAGFAGLGLDMGIFLWIRV